MSNQVMISTWEKLLEQSQNTTKVQWKSTAEEKPAVLLYRDTNAWCPFCERVWLALEEKQIPFQVELINLRDKPKWYTDLVPTGLVPAVKIEGELVYESKDILLKLEEKFPQHPLLPEDSQEKALALEMIESDTIKEMSQTGYKFLQGKPLNSSESTINEEELVKFKTEFENKLNELEKLLQKYPGDYFMSEFSLVDIMYTPALERLSSNLPVFRGYHVQGNDNYPLLNQWFKAMNQRRAYQKVKSDPRSNNLVIQKLLKLQPINNDSQIIKDEKENHNPENRFEAAEKLTNNHHNVTKDILKNAGLKTWVTEESLAKIEEYIDLYLRILAEYLMNSNSVSIKYKQMVNNNEAAAIGAIALSYIRNRVCVPRDMTAGAAQEFRSAIDHILTNIYQ